MNEMKRAKKATLQPAIPLQPAPPKEEIKQPEVKHVAQPPPPPPKKEEKAEVKTADQEKYKELVEQYTREFNERIVPQKNEKAQLQTLAKRELEQLAKDPYLTRILGGYVEATVNGRFDDLEKKLGLLAELSDEDLDELVSEDEGDTSATKKKKKNSTPPPESEEEEDEYRFSSTKEKKGKAPEKTPAKRRRGGGPFGDDSDDEIDFSKSKTESNRQARYQTRPYYRPKATIPDSHLASLF